MDVVYSVGGWGGGRVASILERRTLLRSTMDCQRLRIDDGQTMGYRRLDETDLLPRVHCTVSLIHLL